MDNVLAELLDVLFFHLEDSREVFLSCDLNVSLCGEESHGLKNPGQVKLFRVIPSTRLLCLPSPLMHPRKCR